MDELVAPVWRKIWPVVSVLLFGLAAYFGGREYLNTVADPNLLGLIANVFLLFLIYIFLTMILIGVLVFLFRLLPLALLLGLLLLVFWLIGAFLGFLESINLRTG